MLGGFLASWIWLENFLAGRAEIPARKTGQNWPESWPVVVDEGGIKFHG